MITLGPQQGWANFLDIFRLLKIYLNSKVKYSFILNDEKTFEGDFFLNKSITTVRSSV